MFKLWTLPCEPMTDPCGVPMTDPCGDACELAIKDPCCGASPNWRPPLAFAVAPYWENCSTSDAISCWVARESGGLRLLLSRFCCWNWMTAGCELKLALGETNALWSTTRGTPKASTEPTELAWEAVAVLNGLVPCIVLPAELLKEIWNTTMVGLLWLHTVDRTRSSHHISWWNPRVYILNIHVNNVLSWRVIWK